MMPSIIWPCRDVRRAHILRKTIMSNRGDQTGTCKACMTVWLSRLAWGLLGCVVGFPRFPSSKLELIGRPPLVKITPVEEAAMAEEEEEATMVAGTASTSWDPPSASALSGVAKLRVPPPSAGTPVTGALTVFSRGHSSSMPFPMPRHWFNQLLLRLLSSY